MALSQQELDQVYNYFMAKGVSLAGLPVGGSDLSAAWLAPAVDVSTGSAQAVRVPLSALKGDTGKTPNITLAVNDIAHGSEPTVSKTGTLENPSFTIGMPVGKDGEKPLFRRGATAVEYKYENEADSEYKSLILFSELMPDVSDFSEAGIRILQQPAIDAAAEANTAAANAISAAKRAEDAADAVDNITGNLQSDWNDTNPSSPNFIQNKPTIPDEYIHPLHTAYSKGLYQITIDKAGHITNAAAVVKKDITDLGIPATHTTYNPVTAINNVLIPQHMLLDLIILFQFIALIILPTLTLFPFITVPIKVSLPAL